MEQSFSFLEQLSHITDKLLNIRPLHLKQTFLSDSINSLEQELHNILI